MDILDELKMLADHIDDENNGKPDALSLLLIRTIGEIRKLRADLAKVTWQRNEAQAGLAAMTKSRDAAMRIVTAKDQQMSVLRTQQDQWSEARNTLESERAANARITADLAASRAESERLSSMIDHQRDEAMEMERMLRAELADSQSECERLRELDGRWVALVAADDDCHS